jgi:hypothetical protein
MSDSPDTPAVNDNDTPDFATLAADPDIAPLLDFEPVPMRKRVNGWDADAQRAFIALLAMTGSKLRAATAIGRSTGSLDRILKRPDAAAFSAAFDRALAVAERKNGMKLAQGVADVAARGAKSSSSRLPEGRAEGAPRQILNEFGEWEDEESLHRRADEARDGMSRKLLNARRLYLQEISHSPGKRAAFEILTELPIDWERAALLQPQADEPWRYPNQRQPDMILTAESGWSWGECGYGPDRMAELHRALDEARAEMGLPPIESTERSDAGAKAPPE